MTGGDGSDVFTFEALSDSTASNENGMDIITDFTQGDDLIDLSALGYESLDSISVISADGSTTISGVNDAFQVQLDEEVALQDSDFILV